MTCWRSTLLISLSETLSSSSKMLFTLTMSTRRTTLRSAFDFSCSDTFVGWLLIRFFFFFSCWQNLQSTNWQTLRFKPPPPSAPIGWRVEFRSMEVQITDFENAAFSIFIVLLSRAILSFGLNFYLPISKVGF